MARLSEPDAGRWHALAGRVTVLVERALPPTVLANRAVGGGRGWSLEPVGPALRRARHLGRRMASASLVVRTDVAAFYPSVTPSRANQALLDVGAEGADARLAAAMLEGWGSEGYPGLPIGPAGSAILANAVLRPVDRAVTPSPWLRWVDDYLIALPPRSGVEEILERLDESLDGLGLSRSAPKTVTAAPPAEASWLGRTSLAPEQPGNEFGRASMGQSLSQRARRKERTWDSWSC
jgi:hypothetical protein